MPGFKDFTSAPLSSADVDGYLMQQTVIQCTSGTRPSSPNEGMTVYETDTDRYSRYSGSAWHTVLDTSWTAFTPNIRFFIGGGGSGWTSTGAYKRIGGGLLAWEAYGSFTVSAIMSGQLCVDLPFTPDTEVVNLGQTVGWGRVVGISRRTVMVANDAGNPGLGIVHLADDTAVQGSSTGIWGTTVGDYCAVKFSGQYRVVAG